MYFSLSNVFQNAPIANIIFFHNAIRRLCMLISPLIWKALDITCHFKIFDKIFCWMRRSLLQKKVKCISITIIIELYLNKEVTNIETGASQLWRNKLAPLNVKVIFIYIHNEGNTVCLEKKRVSLSRLILVYCPHDHAALLFPLLIYVR